MIRKIFAILILICSLNYSQTILDLIQPINLLQDQPTKVLVSDIFYSDNYNVEFTSSKNVDVSYDTSTMEVSFTPKNNFSGIELFRLSLMKKIIKFP